MEEKIKFYDDILKQYNPKSEQLDSQKYIELRNKIILGDEASLCKLKCLCFAYLGEMLKNYYISNDINQQNFEDDFLDMYHIADYFSEKCSKYQYLAFYNYNVKRSFKIKMKNKRSEEEKDACVIYSGLHFAEIEDFSSKAEDLCFVKEDLRLLSKKISNMHCSGKTKNILLDILKGECSQKEIAQKNGVSAKYISLLHTSNFVPVQKYAEEIINK